MSDPIGTMPVDPGTRRRGIGLVLVVFVLGLVCGAALSIITIRAVMPDRPMTTRGESPPPGGPGMPGGPGGPGGGFERMAERLDLTREQRREIREIMKGSRLEIRQILEESGDQIRELLDDDQRAQFDRMRRRPGPDRRRGRPGPPPPPGH